MNILELFGGKITRKLKARKIGNSRDFGKVRHNKIKNLFYGKPYLSGVFFCYVCGMTFTENFYVDMHVSNNHDDEICKVADVVRGLIGE